MSQGVQIDVKAIQAHRQNLTREAEFVPNGLEEGFTLEIEYTNSKRWRKALRATEHLSASEAALKVAQDKTVRRLLAQAVKGWRDLTPDILLSMVDTDPEVIPEGTTEIAYSPELCALFVEENGEFSSWLLEETKKLAAFRLQAKEEQQGNLLTSPGGSSPPGE